jgi:LEA14-like dessication related protein
MLLSLALALAAPAQAAAPPPVEVRLLEVQGLNLTRAGATATVRVEATRTVGTPLKVRGLTATVLLNQVELATTVTDFGRRLPRDTPVVFDIPVTIDAATAATAALGALGRGKLNLRVEGHVDVTAWWVFRRQVPVKARLSP